MDRPTCTSLATGVKASCLACFRKSPYAPAPIGRAKRGHATTGVVPCNRGQEKAGGDGRYACGGGGGGGGACVCVHRTAVGDERHALARDDDGEGASIGRGTLPEEGPRVGPESNGAPDKGHLKWGRGMGVMPRLGRPIC